MDVGVSITRVLWEVMYLKVVYYHHRYWTSRSFFGLISKCNILSSLNVIHLGFRLFCFSPGVCFCLQGNEVSSLTVPHFCRKQLKSHSQWLSLISYYHYRKSAATFFGITFSVRHWSNRHLMPKVLKSN